MTNNKYTGSLIKSKKPETLIEAADNLLAATTHLGKDLLKTTTLWGIILIYITATSLYFGTHLIPLVYKAGYNAHYGIDPETEVLLECSHITTIQSTASEIINNMEIIR